MLRSIIFSVVFAAGLTLPMFRGTAQPVTTNLTPTKGGEFEYSSTSKRDRAGVVRALYAMDAVAEGTPELVARAVISRLADQLQIDDPQANLRVDRVVQTGGESHIRFIQTYNSIPVYRSDVVVSLSGHNTVCMVTNNYRQNIEVDTDPVLTPAVAIGAARTHLNVRGPSVGKPDEAELCIYPIESGQHQLAYRVRMTYDEPAGDWEIFVDASSGAILHAEDQYVRYHDGTTVDGSGYVYLTDPLSAARARYGDPGFVDNNDHDSEPLRAYRTRVALQELTLENGLAWLKAPGCAIADIQSPVDTVVYASADPHGFVYTRDQAGFEAVNAFYHVTTSYRRVRDLGFDAPGLSEVRVDPHGALGQDNSWYSPSGNWIAYGTGGVDDAEDADVIWHEHGHAILYRAIPGWGGGESAALGEGFADYWAASYSRSLAQWSPANEQFSWTYNWDGHNEYWGGRTVSDSRTYPFTGMSAHSAGQVWASALMSIQETIGRDVMDRLVLKSHLYLGSNTTAPDYAMAILQADRDLYGGSHLPTLLYWLGTVKRFVDPTQFTLHIAHTPLGNTTNLSGPFVVRATVSASFGIRPESVKLVCGWNGRFVDTLTMSPTGTPDEYAAALPAVGKIAVYQYYIVA
jgi:hypothetical protein